MFWDQFRKSGYQRVQQHLWTQWVSPENSGAWLVGHGEVSSSCGGGMPPFNHGTAGNTGPSGRLRLSGRNRGWGSLGTVLCRNVRNLRCSARTASQLHRFWSFWQGHTLRRFGYFLLVWVCDKELKHIPVPCSPWFGSSRWQHDDLNQSGIWMARMSRPNVTAGKR